ncbi:glutamate ABC transporter substrate-binding protein [Nocardia sp. NPDC050710]|uniref:glutamate ABC transporter substrate-binding protein n=1 Tax=Nocardia sp. NPDC050710 TaxID=3157220 RepID=UPI0034119CFD
MRRPLLGIALAAALAPITACTPATGDPTPTFVIGIDYDQPGLSVMGEDGVPRGFDVDTAIYIAEHLGADSSRIIWKEAPPSRRETLLAEGAVDFVVASYSITAHPQQVSFAGPYLVAGQDLLVRNEDTGIDRPQALDGRTICTAAGSTAADKIGEDFATGVNLTTRESYSACVTELLDGTVDAVSTDDVILAGFAARHPDRLRVVGRPFTRERYGVGVRTGDSVLRARITEAIRAMIADGAWERAMTAHIAPSGYRPSPAPPVFDAPDPESGTADPTLVQAVERLMESANAKRWSTFDALVCPGAAQAVGAVIMRYTPQYDQRLGPRAKDAGFTNTLIGISQTGPDSATFLAHETFTNVPAEYAEFFKDIDYTGTMVRRGGSWMLCALAADFVEP